MFKKFLPNFSFINPYVRSYVNVTSTIIMGENRFLRSLEIWNPGLDLSDIDPNILRTLGNLSPENMVHLFNRRPLTPRETNVNNWLRSTINSLPDFLRTNQNIITTNLVNTNIDTNIETNYIVLPNDDGWCTRGYFESTLIKSDFFQWRF